MALTVTGEGNWRAIALDLLSSQRTGQGVRLQRIHSRMHNDLDAGVHHVMIVELGGYDVSHICLFVVVLIAGSQLAHHMIELQEFGIIRALLTD